MAAYRRRPVVLDAAQWFPGTPLAGVYECVSDVGGEPTEMVGVFRSGARVVVLKPGDWLLKGADGAWCVEAATFAAYYEPADARRSCCGYE